MRKVEHYPFIPKSNSYMKEGQYWDIPLSNGKFSCGRVLQFDYSNGKKSSRSFLAGLMDWVGEKPPTSDAINGAKLLQQGDVHIKTIEYCGGTIRGFRSLELDNITPLLELSHMPVNDCWLVRGYEWLRLATLEERMSLYIHSGWGLRVIKILAEAYFVEKRQLTRWLPWEELMDLKGKLLVRESEGKGTEWFTRYCQGENN